MSDNKICLPGQELDRDYQKKIDEYSASILKPAFDTVMECLEAQQVEIEVNVPVVEGARYRIANQVTIGIDEENARRYNLSSAIFRIASLIGHQGSNLEDFIDKGIYRRDTGDRTPVNLYFFLRESGRNIEATVFAIYRRDSQDFNTSTRELIIEEQAHSNLVQDGYLSEISNDEETRTENLYRQVLADTNRLSNYQKAEYLAGVVQDLDQCSNQIEFFLTKWQEKPDQCIDPSEINDPPTPNPDPEPQPEPVPEDPCPTPNEEKWGVRFRYKVGPNANACLPDQSAKEAAATGPRYNTHQTTYEERDWFLTLLPAMKSVFPGQLDVPNAMPGLQFRVTSNIAKHRVPGFQPIYQHLGVESTFITMVGTFTGDGGLGLVREVTMPDPNVGEWRVASGGVLDGNNNDYNMTPYLAPSEGEIIEGEILSEDRITTVLRQASLTVSDGQNIGARRSLSASNDAGTRVEFRAGSSLVLTGSYSVSQDSTLFEIQPGFLYISGEQIRYQTIEGAAFSNDEDMIRALTISSNRVDESITNNPDNYALYKVTSDRVKLYRSPSGAEETQAVINKGETVVVVRFEGAWALLTSGYWIHSSHIRPIVAGTLPDTPVAVRQYVPSSYKNGALFLADACMVDCRDPNAIAIEPGYAGLADRFVNQFTAVGKTPPNLYNSETPVSRPVWEIAKGLDSYHEFVSFYKLAVQQGNELEVEINVRKNNDGLGPVDGLTDDPLRSKDTGNPKFKGFLRKMEVYASRSDRTWYQMEFEVTDHALAGTQAINLTNNLNATIEAAMAERDAQRAADMVEAAAEEREARPIPTSKKYRTAAWSTVYLLPAETDLEVNQIIPSSARESTRNQYLINGNEVSARDYEQARKIEVTERGRIRFRRNNITLPITISEEEYRNLEDYVIPVINFQPTQEQEEPSTTPAPQSSPAASMPDRGPR